MIHLIKQKTKIIAIASLSLIFLNSCRFDKITRAYKKLDRYSARVIDKNTQVVLTTCYPPILNHLYIFEKDTLRELKEIIFKGNNMMRLRIVNHSNKLSTGDYFSLKRDSLTCSELPLEVNDLKDHLIYFYYIENKNAIKKKISNWNYATQIDTCYYEKKVIHNLYKILPKIHP